MLFIYIAIILIDDREAASAFVGNLENYLGFVFTYSKWKTAKTIIRSATIDYDVCNDAIMKITMIIADYT